MSYDAVIAARKEAEAKMTDECREGIRLGLQMKRELAARKTAQAEARAVAPTETNGGDHG